MLEPLNELLPQVESRWVAALLGAVLLIFGRRIYALLLGLAGFVIGWVVVHRIDPGLSPPIVLGSALTVGVICSLLAFWVERIALAIAGFVLGGLATFWLLELLGLDLHGGELLVALVGAGVGLLSFHTLFHGAVIVVSSLIGSTLVVEATAWSGAPATAAWAGLFVLGLILQRRGASDEERSRAESKRRPRKRESTSKET